MARQDQNECGSCDHYDPYPCSDNCRYYNTYPQYITRCEHKTVCGIQCSDASNPLIMKRGLRYFEAWHDGKIVHRNYLKGKANNIDDEGNICLQ